MTRIHASMLAVCILLLSLITGFYSRVAFAESNIKPILIELKKGQLFSLVAPIAKKGGEQYVEQYYAKAFPLAQQFGLENKGSLKTISNIIGIQKHQAWVMFTWPNKKAESDFVRHADWPAIKLLRPLGWEELKIATAEVQGDIDLVFLPEKFYTIAIAWFNPEQPNNYLQYLKNIELPLAEVGGRFMYKMVNPSFEVNTGQPTPPSQITIVEWNSADGLHKLQANEEYQNHTRLLESGIINFELHLAQVSQ